MRKRLLAMAWVIGVIFWTAENLLFWGHKLWIDVPQPLSGTGTGVMAFAVGLYVFLSRPR